jgi:hypothetical protein
MTRERGCRTLAEIASANSLHRLVVLTSDIIARESAEMDTNETETAPLSKERAEELLRAATLLLERGSFLNAVHVLHADAERTLSPVEGSPLPEQYVSREQAEGRHALLLAQGDEAQQGSPAGRTLRRLLRRAPTWAAWSIVLALGLGLLFRSSSALLKKWQWKDEFADGNWVSRYYGNTRFEGVALMRNDISASHDFGSRSPGPGVPKDRWSARWDTCLILTQGTELSLQLASDDGSRLLVDEVVQLEVGPRPGKKSAIVSLQQGVRHLGVELIDKGGKAFVRLEGLNFEGSDTYTFRRPAFEGDDVRCE